ncbi:MAG: homoserine dehydrogenase [Acidobacteria bacterium]|nr:homoserine dehydrogenase [Acidobacteriota bacterium]
MGLGHVGQAVVGAGSSARGVLRGRGLELRIDQALVRDVTRRRHPVCRDIPLTNDPEIFFSREYDIVIEVIGGVEPARSFVARALERGTAVVTANKSLMAAYGPELRALAARRGTILRYEASVLAAVPFLGALGRRPLASSIDGLCGIINGTSNFILSSMEGRGESYADALRKAQALGLAEPDPANDVLGLDAAQKLIVLLQELGPSGFDPAHLEITGIEDVAIEDLEQARALGGVIKPVVSAAWDARRIEAFVGPAFLPRSHPLARIRGVVNGLCLRGRLAGDLFYSGAGAGPDVTAATILDDVVEIAEQRQAGAVARPSAPNPVVARCRPPQTAWFVRVTASIDPVDPDDVAALLRLHGIGLRRVSRARRSRGSQILHVLTGRSARPRLERALADLRSTKACRTFHARALDDRHPARVGRAAPIEIAASN